MPRKSKKSYETEMDTFAVNLRDMMKERKCTQEALAKACNCSRQTIGYYMTGQSKPNTECLNLIAAYLNVTSDYLIGLAPSKSKVVEESELSRWLHTDEIATKTLRRLSADEWGFGQEAFNYLLASPNFIEILRIIAFLIKFDRISTPFEIELRRQGRYPNYDGSTLPPPQSWQDVQQDRTIHQNAAVFMLQEHIAAIAKELIELEHEKTAPSAGNTEDGSGQNELLPSKNNTDGGFLQWQERIADKPAAPVPSGSVLTVDGRAASQSVSTQPLANQSGDLSTAQHKQKFEKR